MSFHFLSGVVNKVEGAAQDVGGAAKAVGHGVITADKAILSPLHFLSNLPANQGMPSLHPGNQVQAFGRAAQDVGRQAVSFGAPLGSEIYNRVVAPVANLPQQTFNTKSLGLGNQDVPSITQTYHQTHQTHGAPLSFLAAGLTAAGAIPGGKPEANIADQLVKSSTKEDALKVLAKSGIDEASAAHIAPAISQTKDPNVIKNILETHNRVPRADVPVFGGQVDHVTSGKIDDVINQAKNTPRTAGTVRVFQDSTTHPDWVFDNVDSLKSYKNNVTHPNDVFSFKDVPKDSLVPTANGEHVFRVAQPQELRGAALQSNLGKSGEAINKHLETIRNAQSTGPELQDAIKGLQQTHELRNTQELSDQAKEAVNKDYTGSLSKVLTESNPSDKTVALGEHLIVQAQKDGKIGEALTVAETLDKNLREHGRSIQAASIISRLSPEGQLLRATRVIRKVRESSPRNIARQNKTAEEIKQQLEKPLGQKEVKQTVKDLANEDLTTGQKLAKNVEGAAKPVKPKKTDALVQELTKKVKQEYLDPKAVVKKDPLAVLKATFGRAEEADKAYPEAQQILREKFAGDPKMSAALDKFFGSKLDLPAAHSTIDDALRNQLKTQGDKVSQIIYKSHIEQGNTVKQTAEQLVHEGFDEKSAQQLAGEVTKRLDKQIADAKVKTLENMAKDSKERVQSTYLDKLNKLSNLGALDKSDYLHLAQAKLNIPHLTPESASKISELSQKLQSLPEGHEKASIVREIANEVHGSIPLSKGQILKGVPGLIRTVKASGDFSFGGRQGLAYLTAHPIRFAQQWPKQFEFFKEAFKGGDSEAFDAMMADIKNHPDYNLLEKSGLSILDPHAHLFNQREEQFIGTEIADKIPGLRKIVDGSSYAYTGLANSLRANEFYAQMEHLHFAGTPITEKVLKDTAKVIDNSTGRGDLGRFEKLGNALSTALFAPRLIASRVNMMDPRYYKNLDPVARQEAVRQLLGLSAFAVGVLGMAKMAGADVEVDPRSADFGKIKVGDTRLDVLGGFTQYIRFGAQFSTGQKINSTTGAQSEAGKGLAGSRFDIILNFFENKEAPFPSLLTTEAKGKDISGNNVHTAKASSALILQQFEPLLAQDIADLFTHPNALHGSNPGRAGAAVGSLFGVGTQTYGQQDLPISGKEGDYLKQLQQGGAPKEQVNATKGFFQLLKSAPARTAAEDRIHKAIDTGDYQKAQALAQEYNNSVNKHIQDSGWVDKNGKYINADLEKEYEKTQIKLTSSSIKQYLKSKEGL